MASAMPSFLARFLRPFTSSAAALSLHAEGVAGRTLPEGTQKATVAAGCFWGVEHLFRKTFGSGQGLLDARVGYCGGDTENPSYRSVCTGRTGHAEALQIYYDPSLVTYPQLLEFFFRMHDPTTKNRQGMDTGTQYRSAVFTHDDEQFRIANEIKDRVQKQWYEGRPVTTEIAPAGEWYDAEDYHQLYLDNNPGGYECPAHFVRNFKELE